MNASVSGVGPTQQPAQVVAPAIPEQRPVPQAGEVQRPTPADMTQQAVQLFNEIFQLPPELNYANGVTYDQVEGRVSKELFDLIANGMKTSDEVQGSDNIVTADEIAGFISNVALFMQMAQLNPNDPAELGRVARLYNKNGGQYTRVNISDFQQIRGLIEQNWTTAGATDPYEKAAQVIGNGAQAAQISPMLDMISRKLNSADYKDAQPEVQKSVLSAFLLASSLQMDIAELYGDGSERPEPTRSVAEDSQASSLVGSGIQAPGTSQEPDNTPALFTVGNTTVTQKIFAAALEEYKEEEVTLEGGDKKKVKDLASEEQRKMVFAELVRQLAAIEAAKKLAGQARTEDIKAVLAGKGIPEANINDELIAMIKQTPLALELVVGLIESGKMSESDFNSQTQRILAGAKFADTAEGQALSREIMGERAGAGSAASVASAAGPGRASNSPVTDAKVSDAYVRAMAVERPEILDLESLRALNHAITQLNENQYSAFVQRYEEMAAGLGDQKSHCGEFFKNKSKAQAIEAMNTVLASAQTEVAGSGIVMPEAETEEKSPEAVTEEGPTETMATEQQADGVSDVPQQNTVAEEGPAQDVDDAAPSPEQEETASVVADPKAETQEPRVMGDIRQQLDKISRKFGEDWQSNIRQLERYYVALQEYIRQLNTDQYGLLSKECEGRLSGLPDDMGGSPLSILYSQLASASDPNEANNRITDLIGNLRSA